MDEDMHGPLGDTHEVVLAMQAMLTALLANVERHSPGTVGSVARTAENVIAETLGDQPVVRDAAIAHVDRLAGQATRLLRRAERRGDS